MAAILNAIGNYFSKFESELPNWRDIRALDEYVDKYHQEPKEIQRLLVLEQSFLPQLKAIFYLSMISETLVDPIFGMTDAIGSVMRKKIEPVITPIIKNIKLLK